MGPATDAVASALPPPIKKLFLEAQPFIHPLWFQKINIHSRLWISRDLHRENFGSYKSDNRMVYFDLNDFDEAILAAAAWEAARIKTGIFVAFEALNIEQKGALNMAQLFLKKYASILAGKNQTILSQKPRKGSCRNSCYCALFCPDIISGTRDRYKAGVALFRYTLTLVFGA